MPDLKPIPTHAEWSSFKKQHKQEKFSVSGVNVGSSFDAYKATVKAGLKNLNANVAAAHALHEALSKYVGKMPKDAKRPKAFDDGVIALRDRAKFNLDAFMAQQHEVALFAQALQRFPGELNRLSMNANPATLQEIVKDQLVPPLMAMARKLDIADAAAGEVHDFNRTRDEIARMLASHNAIAALSEAVDIHTHGIKIFRNLEAALNSA